jgi:predicted transcriptional regulator
MREKSIGCATVVDFDGRPMGVFSERTVARQIHRDEFLDEPVGKHLDDIWEIVEEDDPARYILDAMRNKSLRFLCVVDKNGRAVALTGQKALMESIADFFPKHVQMVVHRLDEEQIALKREGA